MTEIPLRELRNDTSGVLRRVEDGERFTVTVNGRPVAQLVPLPRRKRYLTWEELTAAQADPGLYGELRELLPDTTDDIDDPWDRPQLRERGRRMPLNDSWIAATAIAHRLPVATQDDDYDEVPGLEVVKL